MNYEENGSKKEYEVVLGKDNSTGNKRVWQEYKYDK